jgi:hypothetical protein
MESLWQHDHHLLSHDRSLFPIAPKRTFGEEPAPPRARSVVKHRVGIFEPAHKRLKIGGFPAKWELRPPALLIGKIEFPSDEEVATIKVESYLRDFFKRRKKVYPSDVAMALGIDYELVRAAFKKLAKDNKVRPLV